MISPQYHLPELRQGRLCRIIVRIKGVKVCTFHNRMEKISKKSLVGKFIKQHMGIAGTDTGQCGGVVAVIKA